MTQWREAKSLIRLREQVNAIWPDRKKDYDGTIGDEAHQHRKSDHDPNSLGVVCALDITHDPQGGCDTYALAEILRVSRDPRLQYVISNKKICNADVAPWTWRPYTGSNPHDHHIHISVRQDPNVYDHDFDWNLDASPMPTLRRTEVVTPVLRKGDKSEAVRKLQSRLRALNIDVALDGDFGPKTKIAVKKFQRAHGLLADGVVGPQTQKALAQ